MGLDVIATLLGHTTLAMTQRYAHLGREELRAAVHQLPDVVVAERDTSAAGSEDAANSG